ncbi:MAG TPA: hypothetical protein VFE61_21855 [Candidatus Sulfotelmatobacter sp.]|nr:hypothetical protein [Candidatus Sulfotelmatobacter sp.]
MLPAALVVMGVGGPIGVGGGTVGEVGGGAVLTGGGAVGVEVCPAGEGALPEGLL